MYIDSVLKELDLIKIKQQVVPIENDTNAFSIGQPHKIIRLFPNERNAASKIDHIYTWIQVALPDETIVPQTIKVGSNNQSSYWFGIEKGNKIFPEKREERNVLFSEHTIQTLAQKVAKLHQMETGEGFGSIIKEHRQSLGNYLNNVLDALYKPLFDGLSITESSRIINIGRDAAKAIEDSREIKPVFVFFNITPNNILYYRNEITELINPIGGRIGPAEWDLAAVYENIYKDKKDFQKFVDVYQSINPKINLNLIEKFRIMVQIESLAVQMLNKKITTIPKDCMFKDTFEKLQNRYG